MIEYYQAGNIPLFQCPNCQKYSMTYDEELHRWQCQFPPCGFYSSHFVPIEKIETRYIGGVVEL